jgi:hypothetical protein
MLATMPLLVIIVQAAAATSPRGWIPVSASHPAAVGDNGLLEVSFVLKLSQSAIHALEQTFEQVRWNVQATHATCTAHAHTRPLAAHHTATTTVVHDHRSHHHCHRHRHHDHSHCHFHHHHHDASQHLTTTTATTTRRCLTRPASATGST